MQEIIELIGEEEYKKLVTKYGGTTIAIPKKPSTSISFLSKEAQEKLCREFGGCYVYIAKNKLNRVSKEEVIRLREQGLSIKKIARAVGLSERQVINILRQCNGNKRG